MLSVVAFQNEYAQAIHESLWPLKFLFIGLVFTGSMWIPNDPFMLFYLKIARITSIVYLCYQATMMLVVAIMVNKALVRRVENNSMCAGLFLIACFLAFTAANITLTVIQF